MNPSPPLRRSSPVASTLSAAREPLTLRHYARVLGLDQSGATFAEYLVIAALVALGCLAGFKALRSSLATASGDQGATVECIAGVGDGCAVAQACTGDTCEGPNCFVAGTPVATPDGLVPIERVRRGDEVLTFREETGEVLVGHVGATFVTRDKEVLDVHVRGEATPLRATPGHQFFTLDRGWVPAVALASGEPLVDVRGVIVPVESLTPVPTHDAVYNFEVNGTHTYFVGDARIAVHNPCGLSWGWPFKKKSSGGDSPFPLGPVAASGGFQDPTPMPAVGDPSAQPPPPPAPVPAVGVPPPPSPQPPPPRPLPVPPVPPPVVSNYNNPGRPITWVPAGTTVWRIDDREPKEILGTANGFHPRVPDADVTILDHQTHGYDHDQYISTSNKPKTLFKSDLGRMKFATGSNLYKVRLPRDAADAEASTGRVMGEGEVTVAGHIPRECIESVQKMGPRHGQLADPVPNPWFNPSRCQ